MLLPSDAPSRRLDEELDDLLGLLPMLRVTPRLADRVFDQLVDVLLERLLLDLRARRRCGEIDSRRYLDELEELVGACRHVELLPPPRRV
ncbi:MAG: hypothetical protein HYX34_05005 [Actinobacteria bacterium]|nr:hypothetical protein [Actinomycetota bacterium]